MTLHHVFHHFTDNVVLHRTRSAHVPARTLRATRLERLVLSKMLKHLGLIVVLLVSGVVISPAHAERSVLSHLMGDCQYNENVTLNIRIQSTDNSPAEARKSFETSLETIRSKAKESGIEDVVINSMNYNINPQNYNNNRPVFYNTSGNVGLMLKDVEKATELMDVFSKEGMYPSMNVNMHKSGHCKR